MRRLVIRAVLAVAVSALLVFSQSSEYATAGKTGGGQDPPTAGGSTGSGLPRIAVSHGSGGTVIAQRSFGSGSSGGTTWDCFYFGFGGVDGSGVTLKVDLDAGPITPKPNDLIDLRCKEGGALVYEQAFTFDPAAPFGALTAGFDAAALAENSIPLPLPDIHTSPPRDTAQLVGFATWLWIDDPWRPLEASATLGGVTATVRATPSKIEWDPGDGSGGFTCNGPGLAWDPHHAGRTSDCSHTYVDRSTVDDPTGTFALTATVTYAVDWTATNGQQGTLDPLTRTATVPVTVQEAQAVIH